ncbi:type IV pilin protein [Corallococcus sp. M7]
MMNRLFRKKGGFTLIELMIVVAIIGILAAIAIPNFIRFQAKSKQSEAKTNLKALYTSQKAYFGEKDKYITDFKKLGFTPEAGNRYSYGLAACNANQTVAAREYTTGCIGQDDARFPNPPTGTQAIGAGVTPDEDSCPTCDFNATAIGNVDNDENADTWGITSSATTVTLDGVCGNDQDAITGGEPGNAYNDVSCP